MDYEAYRLLVCPHKEVWTGDKDGGHSSSHWVPLHKILVKCRFQGRSGEDKVYVQG